MLRGQTEPGSGTFDHPMRWLLVIALLGCSPSPAPPIPPPPVAPVVQPMPDCAELTTEGMHVGAAAPRSRRAAKIDDRAIPCVRVRRAER